MGGSLSLLSPGAENPSYATGSHKQLTIDSYWQTNDNQVLSCFRYSFCFFNFLTWTKLVIAHAKHFYCILLSSTTWSKLNRTAWKNCMPLPRPTVWTNILSDHSINKSINRAISRTIRHTSSLLGTANGWQIEESRGMSTSSYTGEGASLLS